MKRNSTYVKFDEEQDQLSPNGDADDEYDDPPLSSPELQSNSELDEKENGDSFSEEIEQSHPDQHSDDNFNVPDLMAKDLVFYKASRLQSYEMLWMHQITNRTAVNVEVEQLKRNVQQMEKELLQIEEHMQALDDSNRDTIEFGNQVIRSNQAQIEEYLIIYSFL